eukprot:5192560-Amphidinium_carterae.1
MVPTDPQQTDFWIPRTARTQFRRLHAPHGIRVIRLCPIIVRRWSDQLKIVLIHTVRDAGHRALRRRQRVVALPPRVRPFCPC